MAIRDLDNQFERYTSFFGPGLVIYRKGTPLQWNGRLEGVSHALFVPPAELPKLL